MTWRELLLSVVSAVVGISMMGYLMRTAPSATPVPTRHFVAYMNETEYSVDADEMRVEGFCTVFLRGGVRFAAVCGQHTVSEAVEVR